MNNIVYFRAKAFTNFFSVSPGDCVVPRKGKMAGLKIFHRFHFSSNLKRMSVIAGYNNPGSSDTIYISAVKGAPEILKTMVRKISYMK